MEKKRIFSFSKYLDENGKLDFSKIKKGFFDEDSEFNDPNELIEPNEPNEPKEGENEEKEEGVRQPTPIDSGDYVKIENTEGLSEKQIEFLKSKPYHYVKDVTNSKRMPYMVGEPYIDIGYKIPFKMYRFNKIDKSKCKYKILFLQFDLQIDLHGEEDVLNIFRGHSNMSDLFIELLTERFGDDVFVSFSNYEDIHKIKSNYFVNGNNLRDFDFVFFGHISKFTAFCKMIVDYLEKNNIPYIKYGTYNEFDNKAYEYNLLDSLGYPYIPSIMTSKLTRKIIDKVERDFGFPVIVKNVTSNRGEGVYKIDDLKKLIKFFSFNTNLTLIQKLIPNDGDFRLICIKNHVELIIKKERISETEFRANVARGGKAVKADLPKHIVKMCEDVSKILDSDIIGFDIIQDKETKDYYIMEANAASHFSTFAVVSGVNIPQILINYIIKKIDEKK